MSDPKNAERLVEGHQLEKQDLSSGDFAEVDDKTKETPVTKSVKAKALTPTTIDDVFRGKVRSVTLIRVLVVTILLAATIIMQDQTAPDAMLSPETRNVVYFLAIAIYAASGFYFAILMVAQRYQTLVRLTWVQIAVDLVFAFVLALYTGGTGSVFSFFFSLTVVISALLLFRRGALLVATISTAFFILLVTIELSPEVRGGVMSLLPGELTDETIWGRATAQNMVVNITAFYAIALLSSYLAELLRAADQRIAIQSTRLESLEGLLDNIINSIPIGVITLDENGNLSFMNPEALRICGQDAKDALGQPVSHIFPDVRHILANRHKAGRIVNEITSQFLSGEIRLLRWTITPLQGPDPEAARELLIFEDITDLVMLQKEMQESRDLAAVGQLAADIAHEIRNPLGAISGCVQMLRDQLPESKPDGQTDRMIEIILRETGHLNRWIGDFLTYARPHSQEFKPVDLSRMVQNVVSSAQQDAKFEGIDIVIKVSEKASVMLEADSGQIEQVLWNIIQNSQQALSNQDSPEIMFEIEGAKAASGEKTVLRVRDNGCGIDSKNHEQVFEPFFTTRKTGTGLGLATVRRIIQNHGGTIRLDSHVGKGTEVEIMLPALPNDTTLG